MYKRENHGTNITKTHIMAKGIEEIAIRKIEAGIRAIKNGISPMETKAGYFLKKLEALNEGMHRDLASKYAVAVANSNISYKEKLTILS